MRNLQFLTITFVNIIYIIRILDIHTHNPCGYPYLPSKLNEPQIVTRNGTKYVRPTFHKAGYS